MLTYYAYDRSADQSTKIIGICKRRMKKYRRKYFVYQTGHIKYEYLSLHSNTVVYGHAITKEIFDIINNPSLVKGLKFVVFDCSIKGRYYINDEHMNTLDYMPTDNIAGLYFIFESNKDLLKYKMMS